MMLFMSGVLTHAMDMGAERLLGRSLFSVRVVTLSHPIPI